MVAMRFREQLAAEFERRRQQNPRYSLRGFARALGVHHATLSRLLSGSGPVQARTISALGERIGLTTAACAALVEREDTAAILWAVQRPTFRPDCRALASVCGLPIDRVNIALQALLRDGRVRMPAVNRWSITPTAGADIRG